MKEYRKEGDKLIIEIPLRKQRYDPYGDRYTGEMDNIIGLWYGPYENGLAYRIDRKYKGKDDDFTDYFFKLNGDFKEFEKMCKELGITWVDLHPNIHYSGEDK